MLPTSFPPEVVAEIASHLYHDADDTTSDIVRCSLVSMAFRDHFQPWLFECVKLSDGSRDTEEQETKDARRAAQLLACLSRRVDLAKRVKEVALILGSQPSNEDIPKILEMLPSLTQFILYGIRRAARWTQLTPAMKSGITAVCHLPSLLRLSLVGFPTLPFSLLGANPKVEQLGVAEVAVFTEGEPTGDFNARPITDIPATSFASIRILKCVHKPSVQKNTWISSAIKASGASGTLQTLSLAAVFEQLQWFPSFQPGENPFGDSYDLTSATSLHSLDIRCLLIGDPDGGLAQQFFEAFCRLAGTMIKTCGKDAPLEELSLYFITVDDPDPFLRPSFWDISAWNELCDILGSSKSRMRQWPRLRNVRLGIEFCDVSSEASAPAISAIESLILKVAPDIDVAVTYRGAE